MQAVDKNYLAELDEIISAIQASEALATYLEEEDDEIYNQLKDQYEPQIAALYNKIADENPLQLVEFEEALINPELEGLFIPRIRPSFAIERPDGFSVGAIAINTVFKND